MKDEVTIYLYYLKEDKSLRAHTLSKKFAKRYEQERNMSLFHKKVKTFEKNEAGIFINQYKTLRMIELPLYDGKTTMSIIGTIQEEDALTASVETMENDLEAMLIDIENTMILKEKVQKAMAEACHYINKDNDTAAINTFELFFHLNKNTF